MREFLLASGPILALTAGASFLVLLECFPKHDLKPFKFGVALFSFAVSLLLSLVLAQSSLLSEPTLNTATEPWLRYFWNSFQLDKSSVAFFAAISGFGLLSTVFLSASFKRSTAYGEILVLTIFIAAGMQLLVSAGSLLMVFLALEMLSLPTYVLVGIQRRSRMSTEAALKYFLFGSLASVFLVFGIALVYGQCGSLMLGQIQQALHHFSSEGTPALALAGLVLITVAAGFKMGLVPFHMWLPDVYQGAPSPVTGFMGSAIKLAAFGLAVRLLWGMFLPLSTHWVHVLDVIAIATMFVGNLAALVQDNLKRLFAYSSISHAGYLLLGITSVGADGGQFASLYYYLVVYGLMFLGTFAILSLIEDGLGSTEIYEISGFGTTNPFLAACFAIFSLSAAGIPPTAGFFAKYFLFFDAVRAGKTGMVVLAVLSSLIGAYFYLRIVVHLYMKESKQYFALPRGKEAVLVGIALCAISLFFFAALPSTLGL